MIPIDGQPILTAAQMRAAEDAAIAAGSSVQALMELAGAGVAEAVRRLAAGSPVLVLCGPDNNGGDGYVAARILKANGVDVTVASTGDPRTKAAIEARAGWSDPVLSLDQARPVQVVVDAVFGTGLSRDVADDVSLALNRLDRSSLKIAVDVPSGLDSDTGEYRTRGIIYPDVTLALGALKPVHVLAETAGACGAIRVIALPIVLEDGFWDTGAMVIGAHKRLHPPGAFSTKYTRGMVAVIGGAMPGAAALAAEAAMRAGAGYTLLLSDEPVVGVPHAVVQRRWAAAALDDKRIDVVVVGPGLGRDDNARAKLDAALAADHAVVIDGDALHLMGERTFHDRTATTILTPHGGEFKAMFGDYSGNKIDAARDAAKKSGAVVIFKGSDTMIADPLGKVIVVPNGPAWLSTAGTGDVLAGTIAAMAHDWDRELSFGRIARQSLRAEMAKVPEAVWLHGEAARRLGGAFIADDLARALSAIRAAR